MPLTRNLHFIVFENNSPESRKMTIRMRNVENRKKVGKDARDSQVLGMKEGEVGVQPCRRCCNYMSENEGAR